MNIQRVSFQKVSFTHVGGAYYIQERNRARIRGIESEIERIREDIEWWKEGLDNPGLDEDTRTYRQNQIDRLEQEISNLESNIEDIRSGFL